MTEKDKKDLIEVLLEDKRKYEISIQILEVKTRCEKEHLETINNVLDNLQN